MSSIGGNDKRFHPADYVLFAAVLMTSLGIGVVAALSGGRQKTTKEYLMGNRSFSVVPVSLSIFMSFISAILVLGNSAEMYTHGSQFWLAVIGSTISYVISSQIFVPLFFPLKLTSSFEYLERRYQSKAVKIIGIALLMISQIIYMGIAMFAPATALEAVTGFPVWGSILASGVVATIYTAIGGMKAVVWTDVFQGIVYLAGIIIVLAVGSNAVGGITKVWDIAYQNGRINFFNFDPYPTARVSFWPLIFGMMISTLQTMGTGQTSVQRYCALPSLRKAKMAVLLNTPFLLLVVSLVCLVGLVIFAHYENIGCDPLRAGYISNSNQLLPYFVMDVVNYPGIPGIFLAVLFSGALSSLSSSLSALSAVAWKDMLEWKFHYISEGRKAFVTKCLSVFFGILGVCMAFMASGFHGHVMQVTFSFTSAATGPLLGMFILGAFFPWANYIGACVGSICGFILTMTIAVGSSFAAPHRETLPTSIYGCVNLTDPRPLAVNPENVNALFRISFVWNSTVGTITTVIIGMIITLATGPMDPSKINPSLIVPVFDRLWCCLPERIRRKCWCGVDYDKTIDYVTTKDYDTTKEYDTTNRSDGEDDSIELKIRKVSVDDVVTERLMSYQPEKQNDSNSEKLMIHSTDTRSDINHGERMLNTYDNSSDSHRESDQIWTAKSPTGLS